MINSSKLLNRDTGKSKKGKFFIQANKKIVSIGGFLQKSFLKKRSDAIKKRNEDLKARREREEQRLEDRKTNPKSSVRGFGRKLGRLSGVTNLVDGFKNAIGKLLFGFFALKLLQFYPLLQNILPMINGAANFLSAVGIGLIDTFARIVDFGYNVYDSTKGFLKQVGGENIEGAFDKFMGAVSSLIDVLLLATLIRAGGGFGGPRKTPSIGDGFGPFGGGRRGRGGRGPRKPKDPKDPKKPDAEKPRGGFPAGTALAGALAAALIFAATRGRVKIPASAAINAVRSSSALRQLVKAAGKKQLKARVNVDEVVSQVRKGQTARRRLAERTLGGVGRRRRASRAAAQRARVGEALRQEMRSTAAAGGGGRGPRDISKGYGRGTRAGEMVGEVRKEMIVGGGPGGGSGKRGGSGRSGPDPFSGGQRRSKADRSQGGRGFGGDIGKKPKKTFIPKEKIIDINGEKFITNAPLSKADLKRVFDREPKLSSLEKYARLMQDQGKPVDPALIDAAGDRAATRAGVLDADELIGGKTGPKKLTPADVAPKKPRRVNKPVRLQGAPAPFPVIPGTPKAKISLFKRMFGFTGDFFARIPIIGPLVDFGINLAFGDPLPKAATKAIFAAIFSGVGIAAGSVVPGAGNIIGGILGGLAGDVIGGVLYDMVVNNFIPSEAPVSPETLSNMVDPEGKFAGRKNKQRAKDLAAVIREGESGDNYGATYSGYLSGFPRKNEDITKMTIAEVVDYQNDYLDYQKKLGIPATKRSAAVGAYQMLFPDIAAKQLKIPLTAKFDKATQDKLLNYYLDKRGRQQYEAGQITAEEYNDRLAAEFASLKTTMGGGVYDNDGINKATRSVLDLLKKDYKDRSQGIRDQASYEGDQGSIYLIYKNLVASNESQQTNNQQVVAGGNVAKAYHDTKNILYAIG